MEIRKYILEDTELLMKLQIETIKSINSSDYSSKEIEAWLSPENMNLDFFAKTLKENIVYVSLIDDKIVGFGELNKKGEIKRLYTNKNYQGKGVASRLLKVLEQEAKKMGLDYLILESTISAKNFYESKGFIILGKKVENVNGVEHIGFDMKKKLI